MLAELPTPRAISPSSCYRRNLTGLLCVLIFLVSMPGVASTEDSRPALCLMSGCSCVKHEQDDSISIIECPDVGFKTLPNLEIFPNLTQL